MWVRSHPTAFSFNPLPNFLDRLVVLWLSLGGMGFVFGPSLLEAAENWTQLSSQAIDGPLLLACLGHQEQGDTNRSNSALVNLTVQIWTDLKFQGSQSGDPLS